MKILNAVDRFLFHIAKLGIFICMVLITANSGGRFLFNQPITGAYEITENYLMIIMVFLTLSYTWKMRGFIAVTFISDKFPLHIRNMFFFLTLISGIAFFSLIGYEGFLTTSEAIVKHHTTSGLIKWPTYTSTIWVPLGCLVIVLRMLLEVNIGLQNMRKNGIKSDLFIDLNESSE